jgi:hypothetical protein
MPYGAAWLRLPQRAKTLLIRAKEAEGALLGSAALRRQPQDDVAVALAGPAHRAEPIRNRVLKPDQALEPDVYLCGP